MMQLKDRRMAWFLYQHGIWKGRDVLMNERYAKPYGRFAWLRGSWLFDRMLARQERDDRHHAPACPANHFHYRELVFRRCSCSAISTRPPADYWLPIPHRRAS